jgi:enamine deaminase RidA (YjgF/YER057c/UK114 family)
MAYCRAIRVRDLVWVAATAAFDEAGQLVGRGSVGQQADYVFAKISGALLRCGTSLKNVVRTRAYVRDTHGYEEYARMHRKHFQGIDPVATCTQVVAFADPDILVEVEVDAVLEDAHSTVA